MGHWRITSLSHAPLWLCPVLLKLLSTDKESVAHHFFLRAALALPSSCCVHAPCLGALTARRRVSSIIGSANLETSSMDFASAMTFAWKYGCRCLPNPRHFLRISVSVILFQENRAEDDCRSHGAMLRKSSCRQDLVRRVCVSRVTVPDSYRGVLHEWRGCQCQPEEHH